MKYAMLTVLSLAVLTAGAQARLWETEQQCEARYGKPIPYTEISPGSDKTLSYTKDGLRVFADFVKGRCLRIIFLEVPRGQVSYLMKVNSGGSSWITYDKAKPNLFVTANGLAKAGISDTGATFYSTQWERLNQEAIQKAAEAKRSSEKQSAPNLEKKGF